MAGPSPRHPDEKTRNVRTTPRHNLTTANTTIKSCAQFSACDEVVSCCRPATHRSPCCPSVDRRQRVGRVPTRRSAPGSPSIHIARPSVACARWEHHPLPWRLRRLGCISWTGCGSWRSSWSSWFTCSEGRPEWLRAVGTTRTLGVRSRRPAGAPSRRSLHPAPRRRRCRRGRYGGSELPRVGVTRWVHQQLWVPPRRTYRRLTITARRLPSALAPRSVSDSPRMLRVLRRVSRGPSRLRRRVVFSRRRRVRP